MVAQHYKSSHWIGQGVFDELLSFDDFESRVDALPEEKDRGDVFEIFVEALLETQSIMQCEEHWVVGDIPLAIREELNLPSGSMGIDGVYRDRQGHHVPYQVKYRQEDYLTFTEVAPFLGVTERANDRVIFSNASRLSKDAVRRDSLRMFLADWFNALDRDDFQAVVAWLKNKPLAISKFVPDPRYQPQALADIKSTLSTNSRAHVVMACGTGKTLVSLWAAEQEYPKTVLVLVPSIMLLKQTLKEWTKHTNFEGGFSYRCVCSDKTVGLRNDEQEVDLSEVGFPVDTDPGSVRTFLELGETRVKVVFSTYQSSPVVGEAMQGLPPFDIAIFDEAHKTTGRVGTRFSFALSDENLPITKRLFFTATPRHYDIRKRDKEGDFQVHSMKDEKVYGPRDHSLSFAAAVKLGVICPYKVIITLIDKETIDDFLLQHSITLIDKDFVRARWVANLIAVQHAIKDTGAKKAITFHNRVERAQDFAGKDSLGIGRYLPGHEIRHVNGKMSASDRSTLMGSFRDASRGLVTNARCLMEGVDVALVDMVAFVDPKHSRVDIAQAIGRAMRKPRGENITGKTTGYVVVPLFAGGADDQTVEEAVHSEGLDDVSDVINALQEHDGDLFDIINSMRIQKGEGRPIDRGPWRKKIDFLAPKVELKELYESISSEICDRLGSNWYEWLGRLKAYKAREGHCRVPKGHQEDGFDLAEWVFRQRTSATVGKLSSERRALLDELGFVWDILEADWLNAYEHLKAYKARKGNCRVPSGHKEDGFDLAAWVFRQRKRSKAGKLSAERRALLDELGFVWNLR